VDALAPAADTLNQENPESRTDEALLAAADSTAALRARRGCASYVGERAVGAPGAVAIALLSEAAAQAVDPAREQAAAPRG
jgi:dihydroxyacetone kinase-like protein